MGTRETHTIEELRECVVYRDDLIAQAAPGTREHTEQTVARRHYARRLEAAEEQQARRERDDARDPREVAKDVVDRILNP